MSAKALVSSLPLEDGKKTPSLFCVEDTKSKSLFFRAAKKAGFHSKLVNYTLEDISVLLLPVILVLKNDGACILTEISADKKFVKIILPDLEGAENWVKFEELQKEYLGYAFLVKPELNYDNLHKSLLKQDTKHWFWSSLKYSKNIYIDVIVASFIINLFVIATPIFTLNIYDRVVPNNAIDTMWVFVSGIVLVYIFDFILKFLRSYFLETAAKKSDIIISSIIFEHVMSLKLKYKPKSVGSFASNIKDFDTLRNFFNASTISILVDLPFSFLFLFTIYFLSGSLVIIPIFSALIIILYSLFIERPMKNAVEQTHVASSMKNSILIEALSSIEIIKALGISGHSQWKFEEATAEVATKGIKSKLLSNSVSNVVSFVVHINTVLIIIGGVYAISEQLLTMGALIATVMLSSRMLAPLGQVASLIANFEQAKNSYTVLDSIMKQEGENEQKFIAREEFNGKIEFKNVSFSYPNSEKKVLDNVSFVINPGENLAIIGANGSGKTTIQKLILKLYEPTEGTILIDDIDINQLDASDLRENMAYVPQETILFSGTLKDNIIVRKPNATDDEIVEVAKLTGLDKFVNKDPQGFYMPIAERGDGLSGGQKQLVALSRALLYETPFILFDEPTSAMDSYNENYFLKQMPSIVKDKTFILVSHKHTLLQLVDRVMVLVDGKIVLDDKKEKVLSKLKGK